MARSLKLQASYSTCQLTEHATQFGCGEQKRGIGLKWRLLVRKKPLWQGRKGRFFERQRMKEAIPWQSINTNTINNWYPIQQQQKQSESTFGGTEVESAHSSSTKRFCFHIGVWYRISPRDSSLATNPVKFHHISNQLPFITFKLPMIEIRYPLRGTECNSLDREGRCSFIPVLHGSSIIPHFPGLLVQSHELEIPFPFNSFEALSANFSALARASP
jgi:hypothetical protein